jgi:hypothetical protein
VVVLATLKMPMVQARVTEAMPWLLHRFDAQLPRPSAIRWWRNWYRRIR